MFQCLKAGPDVKDPEIKTGCPGKEDQNLATCYAKKVL